MIGQIDFIRELKSKNEELENEIICLNNILRNLKNNKIKKEALLYEESTNNTTNKSNFLKEIKRQYNAHEDKYTDNLSQNFISKINDQLNLSDIYNSNKNNNLLNIIQDIHSINFKSNLVNTTTKNDNFFCNNEKFCLNSKTLNERINQLETQKLDYLNNINLLNNTISELKIKNKFKENKNNDILNNCRGENANIKILLDKIEE